MQNRHKMLRNERGFTLIEIMLVLVALGVLALAAIPKYMDLTEKAREKAAQGAIAEVKGRCSMAYAKLLLENNGDPTKATASAIIREIGTSPSVGEDFKVTVKAAGKAVEIAVTTVDGVKLEVQDSFTLPNT